MRAWRHVAQGLSADGVNGRQSLIIVVTHGLIVVVVLLAATVLTALRLLPIDVTEGFYGAALAWGGAVSSGVIRRTIPKRASVETHVVSTPEPVKVVVESPPPPAPPATEAGHAA